MPSHHVNLMNTPVFQVRAKTYFQSDQIEAKLDQIGPKWTKIRSSVSQNVLNLIWKSPDLSHLGLIWPSLSPNLAPAYFLIIRQTSCIPVRHPIYCPCCSNLQWCNDFLPAQSDRRNVQHSGWWFCLSSTTSTSWRREIDFCGERGAFKTCRHQ